MNLDTTKEINKPAAVRDFLTTELNKKAREADPGRYALLVELIDKANDVKKT